MSKRHVLVVDDEPTNLDIVSEYLDGLGLDLGLLSYNERGNQVRAMIRSQ